MSVSDSWREDRDGYAVVAGEFRPPVGEFEQGQGERGQDQHQHNAHAVDIHSCAAVQSHDHNTYPPHFNYIENSPTVEYVHGDEQSAYLTSTGVGSVVPVYVANANANSSAPASFFPELSLSPSPSPRLELHSQNSCILSPTSNCSPVSSPLLRSLDGPNSRHQTFSGPRPILQHTPSQLQYTLHQHTPTPVLKRKRGRPPKNSTTPHLQGPSCFTTFNNGFAMTFTEEDDYRLVGENEFEKDGVSTHPVGDAITLDPKKRAERQRASISAIAATAAASRGRRQITNPASSTAPDPKGKIVEKMKTIPMRAVTAGGRASSRARWGAGGVAPKYNHHSEAEDSDDGDDDDDDDGDDDDQDNFSGPSSSNSSSSGSEDQSIDSRSEALPERVSRAGHSLRARGKLSQPDRLKEYVSVDSALRRGRKKPSRNQKKTSLNEQRQQKAKRLGRGLSCQHCHSKRIRCDIVKPKCGNCVKYGCACISRVWVNGRAEVQLKEPIPEDINTLVTFDAEQKPTTQREDIRLAIQQGATKKRFIFFRAYEHLFLPLLPERNFITKLKEAEEKEKVKKMEINQNGGIGMETDYMKTQRGNIVEGNNDQGVTEEDSGKIEAVPYKLLEQQPSK